ncbi:MAG: hypothetical protein JWM42_3956 [Burkholderia sp.]|nr:hypothetical protein [Burkholderia sp.]
MVTCLINSYTSSLKIFAAVTLFRRPAPVRQHPGRTAKACVASQRSARASLSFLALALAASVCTGTAAAQEYPAKPIRLVVGFPPGGGVDIAARLIAAEMQKTLGHTVMIENRSGAHGGIGAELVAKSAPDGYTLLMGNTGSLAINPALYPKLSYDAKRDFAAVALVSTTPLVVLVNPSLPVKSLNDFVALAKSRPGEVAFGSSGSGGISHLTIELLKLQTGINMLHVPYRGSAPAVADLVGGQLQMLVEGMPLATQFVQANKLRALAITSAQRSPIFPDVPTVTETGLPDFRVTAWYGIVAPAGTPATIIAALNRSINTALKDPGFVKKLAQQGSDAAGGTPAQFSEFLDQELTRWAAAVKASGAKID